MVRTPFICKVKLSRKGDIELSISVEIFKEILASDKLGPHVSRKENAPPIFARDWNLEHTIDLTSATGQIERRGGRDRRVHQDWTKVGWERRRSVRRATDRANQPV